MHKFFADKGVEIAHSSFSTIKAGVAERCIRNVKQRLYRYFGTHHTLNWVDVIGDIANAINHSKCRVTGMRPVDVTFKNAQRVWNKVYGKDMWKRKQSAARIATTYKEGDFVRVAKGKIPFQKGYLPTYSDEVYKVDEAKRHASPLVYKLRTAGADNAAKGRYYKHELSRVRPASDYHVVEQVLKKRVNKGVKELYVKLFNQESPVWLLESDVLR